MAPKNRMFTPSSTTKPEAPSPGKQSASLYTIQVHAEMLDTPSLRNAGMQITFYDNRSYREGFPAQRHGMSTLSTRTMALFKLPPPPQGVVRDPLAMRPPLSATNPTGGKSRAFVLAAAGNNGRTATQAINHALGRCDAVMGKAFLEAAFEVPEEPNRAAWKVNASILQTRLALTRESAQNNGGPYAIRELMNFNVAISNTLPSIVTKTFKGLRRKYPNIITVTSCAANAGLSAAPPPTTADIASTTSCTDGQRPLKRPAASQSGASMAKRLARKAAVQTDRS